VLQGIRRIVAITGEEAAAAIKEGETLANHLAAAQKLQGSDLEKEVAALKQVSCHEAFATGPMASHEKLHVHVMLFLLLLLLPIHTLLVCSHLW